MVLFDLEALRKASFLSYLNLGSNGRNQTRGLIDRFQRLIPRRKVYHVTRFGLVRPRLDRLNHQGAVDCNESQQ